MSDLLQPCEKWAESISLAAAGCLSSDEERAVHRHVETCPACREQLRQLTEACRALAEGSSATESEEAAVVERIMSAVAAGISARPGVRTRREMTHPTQLSRTLDIWRWIMRSPVSRISAVVILALAIGTSAVWFHTGGAKPAFADLLEPILTAKTVTYKMVVEGGGQKFTGRVMATASPQRVRTELDLPNDQKMISIFDDSGNSLMLRPADQIAIITTSANSPSADVPKEKRPKAIFFELQAQLAEARNQPDWIREPLGEKEFDGRRLVGYRLTGHGMIWELWGDPKVGMPVRLEQSTPSNPTMKPMVCSDFVFNAELDPSLFSMEPPAEYKVQKQTVDVSPAEEKDLVESLRRYSQLNGGTLPDQLDVMAFSTLFQADWLKTHPMKGTDMSDEERQEQLNGLLKLIRGLSFAFEQLPRESAAHYAGKGIKVGTADTPVFWYQPRNSKKYRIISADLTVREADAAPNVPNAQPVISASGPAK